MDNESKNIIGLFERFAERAEPPETIQGIMSILPKMPNGILIRQYIILVFQNISQSEKT